jgi:hypothetical protein
MWSTWKCLRVTCHTSPCIALAYTGPCHALRWVFSGVLWPEPGEHTHQHQCPMLACQARACCEPEHDSVL